MKCFKRFILICALLLCVIPSNIIKADESDIMPTVVATNCVKCGGDTMIGTKVYTIWMDTGDDGPKCSHGYSKGWDVPQIRFSYIHYVCSNCGYTYDSSTFSEYQLTCKGYN